MDISAILNGKKDKTVMLSVSDLAPNPLQPRRAFNPDELKSLADSIKKYGVIQPIAVKKLIPLPPPMPQTSAKYEIIAGERRWRASKLAGLKEIPCRVFETDMSGSAMMALVENLQRSDLSYFEEAIAMQTLLLMTEMPQGELAKALSISQSALSNKLRLLKLSERERLVAVEHGFSERHCRALVRINSEQERLPIIAKIVSDKLSAPEAECLIESYISNSLPKQKRARAKKKKPAVFGKLGDIKMLFNTLDKSVRMLNSSGYSAKWEKEECEECLTVTIKVLARQ
ncbi:MAG: ParB/RepB/Spo0J family partition protein [Clostridia bacterium]|nr:ParB/RepB/Spo0J family partition protein [Clostridia bacterium]